MDQNSIEVKHKNNIFGSNQIVLHKACLIKEYS